MKTNSETISVRLGKAGDRTNAICRALASERIGALVRQREGRAPEVEETSHHWSGQPGQDLFFNGWKLLF